MSNRIVTAAAVAAMTLLPVCALAQNVVPNSDFNTDLAGWDTTMGTDWSPEDSDGSPSSGSLQIVVTELKSTAITTCVPVVAGETYEFGADIKLEFQGGAEGRAGVVARWEADAGCSNELPDFPANTFLNAAPDWKEQRLTAVAPENAVAALVELRASKSGGSPGAAVTAHLDDAVFQTELSPGCADPATPYHKITSGDALITLRASVGTTQCEPCYCNVNGTGGITASDALVVLKAAVQIQVILNCPSCS